MHFVLKTHHIVISGIYWLTILSLCAFWHILIAFLAGFRPPSSIFRETQWMVSTLQGCSEGSWYCGEVILLFILFIYIYIWFRYWYTWYILIYPWSFRSFMFFHRFSSRFFTGSQVTVAPGWSPGWQDDKELVLAAVRQQGYVSIWQLEGRWLREHNLPFNYDYQILLIITIIGLLTSFIQSFINY